VGYERVNVSEWYYVVGVFNPSTYERFFLDGDLEDEETSGIPSSLNDPAVNIRLARDSGVANPYRLDAIIDEIRVSKVARSADWISAQYLSMTDSFITIGHEMETGQTYGSAYIFFGYPGIDTSNISAANANVTIYGSTPDDHFGWSVSDAGDVNADNYDDIIVGAPEYYYESNVFTFGASDYKLNQISDSSPQYEPVVAVDSDNEYIVVWEDWRNGDYDIYAQKFDSNDNPLWGSSDLKVNQFWSGERQDMPAVAFDPMGNAIVVWRDYRNGNYFDIYAQKFDSDGNPQWGANDVKVNQNGDTFDQSDPRIGVDTYGNAVVVWYDDRDGDWDVFAQKLNSSGVAQWGSSDIKVNQNTDSALQYKPDVKCDSSDNAIIIWSDNRNGNWDVYSQKMNSAGDAQWGSSDNKVNQNSDSMSQTEPGIALDSSDDPIIAWSDSRNGASNNDIYAQKLNSNGVAQWGMSDIKVNQNPDTEFQFIPEVGTDSLGNVLITWEDLRGANRDIYIQKLNRNGVVQWGSSDVKVNQNGDSNDKTSVAIAVDSLGNAIVIWEDPRNGNYDIYGQKINYADIKGRAYIFYGRATGSWTQIDDADTDSDKYLNGEFYGDKFGCSVSGAGDVNNDGYDDIIVGAYGSMNDRGRAYIFYGPDFNTTGFPYSYVENIPEVQLADVSTYTDYLTLTVNPAVSTNYLIIATSDVGPGGSAQDITSLRLRIDDDDSKIYHEVIRQFEDATDWYHFSVMKYLTLSAGSHDIELEYNTPTADDGRFRNTRIIAIEMTIPSEQYTETESQVDSTGTEVTAATMSFTPSSSGDYLIIATANVFHNNNADSAWGRMYIDDTLYGEMLIEPDDVQERMNFGVIKNITMDASVHYINLTIQNDDSGTTASMNNAHIAAIRLDTFSEFYYNEAEAQNNGGAGTWETLVTNSYTPTSDGDFIILGTAEWLTNDATDICGIRLQTASTTRQESQVENDHATDRHMTIQMDKRALSGSQSDTMDHDIDLASGWSKFARLITIPLGTSYTILKGWKANDRFGFSVSNAGRVDYDNFDDVIVGAPGADKAYIFSGHDPMSYSIDASDADAILNGDPGTNFGFSVAGCGNINNADGDDVIVGAPGYNANRGRAYIFYGIEYNEIVTANYLDNLIIIYDYTFTEDWETKIKRKST
jgi:hypothetical protein